MGLTVVSLRPRHPGDDAFILALSAQAFGGYALRPARAVRSMVHSGSARTFIAEVGDEPVGFAVVSLRGAAQSYGPIEQPKMAHLDAIAVIPAQRGRGVGRQLLSQALAVARAERAQAMFLMTAVRNGPARRLFEAYGLQNLAVMQSVYTQGERALIMTRVIKP